MEHPTSNVVIDEEKRNVSVTSLEKDHGIGTALDTIDKVAERAYGTLIPATFLSQSS